ncbi:outer membrane receptor protein involved in Fe transport [Sphingomonas sp. BE138]|uniref:TonB-dependent receptor domain-containing protein n=1 Tax=Sphingomonas sp. BE138 TaxID=2817845 RepID=UPI0028675161|nr:TonB-dependent receptor [Sphingomonas sp. BE138]MDR6789749.1 outer membrane receptor protein involved in Fe transport [Sphingomonas sp. BE138]
MLHEANFPWPTAGHQPARWRFGDGVGTCAGADRRSDLDAQWRSRVRSGQCGQRDPGTGPEGATPSGDIVVTGTLVRNPNLTLSSPVNAVSSEEFQLRQTNVAEQLIRELPGVVPSIGSAVNNGNGGASFVNLRGLGTNRNLVLIDGARIAPAGLAGVVDLNNIPTALLERMEILTGGASTTYGADAVAGVVNFIMKRDFSGVEATASNQITQRGDGAYFRTDLTIGANFDEGRGNAVFSIGYQQADPVYQGARDFSTFNIDSFTGAQGGSGTTVPGRFTGLGLGTNQQIDVATGRLVPTYSLFNFNPQNIFQTPFDRFNMFGAAHYEVAPGIEVYSRGLFSKNNVQTVIASSGTFGNSVTIPYSNPYLPAGARSQICASQGLTTAQCAAAAAATDPTSPDYRTFNTVASRRFVEAGPRLSTYTTTIFDYQAGVRGSITSTINFDVVGSYGESENVQRQSGNGTLTRLRQAALATNTTTCVNDSNGCVPINLFGPAGSITSDQLGFLLGVTNSTATRTTLGTIKGIISGDFGVSSPLATNAISFALGGEYRKYTASVISDELTQRPNEVLGNGAASPDVRGRYSVKEAFVEMIAPLVEDRPFFKSLTLEAGGRVSDYSTAGTNWTWKVGGSWEPVSALKIRGNYQKAARAPNIAELFSPFVVGLDNSANDPCAGAGVTAGSALGAVCAAQIVSAGATPAQANALLGSIPVPSAGQVNVSSGGNPNLGVETANTYTIGAVIQPDFFPGFNLSVDYFNIRVKDAITSPTPGDVLGACFSPLQAATSTACSAIGRNVDDGSLNGSAAGILLPLSNLGNIFTDGIDLSANYRQDLGFGALVLSFNGTWTNRNKFQATPTSLNRECVSYYSINCGSIQPEFTFNQRTTLTVGGADLSLLWRYLSPVTYEPAALADDIAGGSTGPLQDFRRIGAAHYFDLTSRFEVNEHFDVTISAMNLFDRQPKVVGSTIGSTAYNSGNVYPSTYDALGRRFAVAARVRF